MPCVKFRQLIFADQESELVVGVVGLEGFDGRDGVAWAFSLEFAGVGEEVGVAGDGQKDHGEAMAAGSAFALEFVGGDVGGDENDAVGLQEFSCALSGDQVPVMDGVEGSAVEEGVWHGFIIRESLREIIVWG